MDKKRKNEESVPDDTFPDRTMSDFYCKRCDAHMNSEQMWESHISGKRHLKNVKKEPGEMPSKVRAIKVNATAKLMDAIQHVDEPLVGLGFMTELQRADPGLNPSYTCHLCQANLTWSVVIEHILGTKHRLAYLKVVDNEQYEMIDNMELTKTSLDRLTEDRARDYERKRGCGTMEVKLEKPKVVPPAPKREKVVDSEVCSTSRHSRSLSSEKIPDEYDKRSRSPLNYRYASPPSHRYASPPSHRHSSPPSHRYASPPSHRYSSPPSHRYSSPPSHRYASPTPYHRKRSYSPVEEKWKRDASYSPSPPRFSSRSSSNYGLPSVGSLTLPEKLNLLRAMSAKVILMSDSEVSDIKRIIIALSKSIMEFIAQRLPTSKQNRVAKYLVKSDLRGLNHELSGSLEYIFDVVTSVSPDYHRRSSSSGSRHSKRYEH